MASNQRCAAIAGVVALVCCTATALTQTAPAATKSVTIRGQALEIAVLPAQSTPLGQDVLFLPGVGGWRGWAITIAETMASWGYDVYGVGWSEGAGLAVLGAAGERGQDSVCRSHHLRVDR